MTIDLTLNPGRRSLRLKGYDYSQEGGYFVTVCAYQRECLFGKIQNGEMVLNEWGMVVEEEWKRTEIFRPEIILDEFVVMPNHFHGIVIIDRRGTACRAPTREQFGQPQTGSLSTVVRAFKSATSRAIRKARNILDIPVWQRNFHEHIIRDEEDLNRIREYIIQNPLKWDNDDENPLSQW